jgi:hypothetical protein
MRDRGDPGAQCEGFAEEESGDIDVLMVLNITFKARKREVGENCCVARMADLTQAGEEPTENAAQHRSGE